MEALDNVMRSKLCGDRLTSSTETKPNLVGTASAKVG